jgi:hypothetical protein
MKIECCENESPFIWSSVINIYEACATKTHLGMLTVEGIATIRKNSPQAFMQK